mmetsp:Transcript_15874/g.32588  ORF Transcript_15874/g.32588 Transcript_15874/m.32588 type:complete len:202 (-) Transcript_15874:413-1018(-)
MDCTHTSASRATWQEAPAPTIRILAQPRSESAPRAARLDMGLSPVVFCEVAQDLEKVMRMGWSSTLKPCSRVSAIPDCISFSNSQNAIPGRDGTRRTSLNPGNGLNTAATVSVVAWGGRFSRKRIGCGRIGPGVVLAAACRGAACAGVAPCPNPPPPPPPKPAGAGGGAPPGKGGGAPDGAAGGTAPLASTMLPSPPFGLD